MTQEKHFKIIDQIRKLFSLSKSPNENEAALALEKARQLMVKYNIDQTDLASKDISDIIEIDFELAKDNKPAESLSYWIGQAFSIRPILIMRRDKSSKMRFIGSKTDVAVGTYIFSYMLDLIEVKSKEYIALLKAKNPNMDWRGRVLTIKKDYSQGFVKAVSAKLKQLKEDHEKANKYETEVTNALLVVKNSLINSYVNKTIGKVNPGKTFQVKYDRLHYSAGFDEGQKHGLHRGLNKESQRAIA